MKCRFKKNSLPWKPCGRTCPGLQKRLSRRNGTRRFLTTADSESPMGQPSLKIGTPRRPRSATPAPERRWTCLTVLAGQNRPTVGYASFPCENLSPYRKMSHLDDRAKRTATLHAAEKRTLEMIRPRGCSWQVGRWQSSFVLRAS